MQKPQAERFEYPVIHRPHQKPIRKGQAERIARLIRKYYPPLKAEAISFTFMGRSHYAVGVKNQQGWTHVIYTPHRRERAVLARAIPQRRKKAKR